MRSRFKLLISVGAMCLAGGVVASGALAHGGHREKLGKMKKGSNALKVEVRGSITDITEASATAPASITLSAAGSTTPAPAGFTWTCALAPGTDVSKFKKGDRVKARCHSTSDKNLTLTRLRHKDKGDKVKVAARGTLTAFVAAVGTTDGTVTVDTGVTGQSPITCVVTSKTLIFGNPTVNGLGKVECKSKNGVLRAKSVAERIPSAKAKGALTANPDGTVTVNGVTCTVPTGMTLPANGTIVEIKCSGTPLALTKIEVEDDDD